MDSVRKAYQRAVAIPLNNVEQIWSEYNHWEQQLNKLTVSFSSVSLCQRGGGSSGRYLEDLLPAPPSCLCSSSISSRGIVWLWKDQDSAICLDPETAILPAQFSAVSVQSQLTFRFPAWPALFLFI